jgi:hypothetical protein
MIRARLSLALKDVADRLADGPRGPFAWRWHASTALRRLWRGVFK